jgi:hypothetical protein
MYFEFPALQDSRSIRCFVHLPVRLSVRMCTLRAFCTERNVGAIITIVSTALRQHTTLPRRHKRRRDAFLLYRHGDIYEVEQLIFSILDKTMRLVKMRNVEDLLR